MGQLVTWNGDPPITQPGHTFGAATYVSRRLRSHTYGAVSFQWVKTAADSAAVSALDIYGTLVPDNHPTFLPKDESTDDPTSTPWVLLSSYAFASLPGNAAAAGPILHVPSHGIGLLIVRMVVGTEAGGLSLFFEGR